MDYISDPAFRKINRPFVHSFKAGENNPTRNYFVKYYMLLVEIKNIKALMESTNQTRIIRKTYLNVKKRWLYKTKLIKLLISPKVL